jgi:hypothetical protein
LWCGSANNHADRVNGLVGSKVMAEPAAWSERWLTQSEAASRLGWQLERVRSAARRGQLQRRKNNAGQWLVLVTPELAAQPDRAVDQVIVAEPDRVNGQVADRVTAELAEEREASERWREAAEAARIEAAALRAERDTARLLIASLEEQVRWLRRPFWRRWLDRS